MEEQPKTPKLIFNPRQLAAFFATCVTVDGKSNALWVAKNGESSLFNILQMMLPKVKAPSRIVEHPKRLIKISTKFAVVFITDRSATEWKASLQRQDLRSRIQQGGPVRVWLPLHKDPQALHGKVCY